MSQPDSDIVKRCLNGAPDAFRHLVLRYQGSLVGHLTGRLGDREQAEEAAQEAFVRAYLGLGKLRKQGSFFAFLSGIAERVVYEQRRDRDKQRRIAVESVRRQCDPPADPDLPLQRAVAELPDVYREVIQLRYFGGLSCIEAADRLDVPIGTLTKRLSRAYALLREALKTRTEVQS